MQPTWQDGHELVKTYGRFLSAFSRSQVLLQCSIRFTSALAHDRWQRQQVLIANLLLCSLLRSSTFTRFTYMLNFSGYCDIVIAGAALLGNEFARKLRSPCISRVTSSIFWTRGIKHFGFWIRDYLFMPAYKAIAQRVLPAHLRLHLHATFWHLFWQDCGMELQRTSWCSAFCIGRSIHSEACGNVPREMAWTPFPKALSAVAADPGSRNWGHVTLRGLHHVVFPRQSGRCLRPIKALIAADLAHWSGVK